MRAVLGVLALLAVGACAQTGAPPQTVAQAPQADTCGMAAFERYIGRPASEIDRAALPQGARVITPEMAVTMDFRAERLNIMVGTDGRVGSLRCF